ncbi:MAG: DHH family phosphoesterase [Muribaculaceae bacterium]|nr:DHH family phosphoesterase [Muribaculaceae bacterium]
MTLYERRDLERFAHLLATSKSVVITCHLSPDGDALGSSLGLRWILTAMNRSARVYVVTPDEPTRNLAFLPGFKNILPYTRSVEYVDKLLDSADLLICLDFNELSRTDRLAVALRQTKACKLHIDHHLYPEDFADLLFSAPRKSSTCLVLYELIRDAGLKRFVSKNAANCLLCGMMTDTGNFSYNVSDPAIYSAIGDLVSLGADKERLNRLLFDTFSESNLRIQGYALANKMELFHDMHAALIVLSRDELNAFGYQKGDTEGLVNRPLAVPGILYSCYLREETDYIKVSMRSLGDLPVNELCTDFFGGGGHLNAAGGEYRGSMDDCIKQFKDILAPTKQKYIDGNRLLSDILNQKL